MKKLMYIATALVALVSLGASHANAEFIGFEAPTYTTTGGAGGTAQIVGQDGWVLSASSPGNATGALISNSVAYAGSQSLRTSEDDNQAQTRYGRSGFTAIGGQTGASVDFYAMTPNTGVFQQQVLYYLGFSTTNTNAGAVVGLYQDKIRYYNGSTATDTAESTAANVWYHFTITFDFDSPTRNYDLTVQSVGLTSGDAGYINLSLTDVPFRNQAVSDVTAIMILSDDSDDGGSQTAVFYTDNLSFNAPVPEPGMLSLVGIGGLIMLARRSRP